VPETDENAEIDPSEFLLRRVLNRDSDIDLNLARPVSGNAFNPNQHDTDGLSLFRKQFVSPEEVAASGRNPLGYYVVQVQAAEILELGVTLEPDPQPDTLPGHTLIPELTHNTQKQTKRDLRGKLAQLVNQDPESRIILRPG